MCIRDRVGGVKAVCHVTVKDKVCDAHWEGEQYIQEDGEPARGIAEIEGKSYLFREEDGAVQKNAQNFAYGDYEYSTNEEGVVVGVRVPEAVTSVPAQQFFGLKQLEKAEVGAHVTYLGKDFIDASAGTVIYTSRGSLAAAYAQMRNIPCLLYTSSTHTASRQRANALVWLTCKSCASLPSGHKRRMPPGG